MYPNHVTRAPTAALRLLCSFGRGVSEYWKSWPKKSQNYALVVVLTGFMFCLGLKLVFGLFHAHYWEWMTTSRFSNAHSADEIQGNGGGDHLCDSFPSYLLSRIQVILKIGSTEPPSQVDTHLKTVTCCITNLIFFSDHKLEIKGHRVHDILATLLESFWGNSSDFQAYSVLQRGEFDTVRGSQGWILDKYKFLPMVERAYEMNPTAQWFVFTESNTYFVWDNLFRLLDQFDPSLPLYFGYLTPGKSCSFFAYGGARFVLSTAAIQKLVAREVRGSSGYERLIKDDCCGDSVLGWTLYQSRVKLSGMWPMFNPHPLHGIPFNEPQWCQPVISMHKLSLEDMTDTYPRP